MNRETKMQIVSEMTDVIDTVRRAGDRLNQRGRYEQASDLYEAANILADHKALLVSEVNDVT